MINILAYVFTFTTRIATRNTHVRCLHVPIVRHCNQEYMLTDVVRTVERAPD